ncbi:MAG: hypothetical protein HC874_30390 [Richelia sp. SL_2_1]|nr:hypothetical protein [Richelia sp. SL_2_1]
MEYCDKSDDLYDMLDSRSEWFPSIGILIILNSQRIKNITLEQVAFILYAYRNYDMTIDELFPLIDKVNTNYLTELLNNYPESLSSEEYHKLLRLNIAFDKLAITGKFNYNENI